MDFNIFKNDWERIPVSFRYLILSGIILILIVWLFNGNPYRIFFLWDFREITFNIGLILIFLGLIAVVLRQFWVLPTIFLLRRRYPVELIGSKIIIVSFSGHWQLFDKRDKSQHWIENPQTVRDLSLAGSEHLVNTQMNQKITINGEVLDPAKFSHGDGIKTQG